MKYMKRDIMGTVGHALEQMPVVVVTGIRQSGVQRQPFLKVGDN